MKQSTKKRRSDPGAAAELMYLLADRTRLRLLSLLARGERSVNDLCSALGCPQPSCSHHLGILKGANAVTARRAGKQVFYRLATPPAGPGIITLAAGGAAVTVSLARKE